MSINNLSYTLKTCITTAVVAPAIVILTESLIFKINNGDVLHAYFINSGIGSLIGLPLGACFYMATRYVNKDRYFIIGKKSMLVMVGLFLAFVPSLVNILWNGAAYANFADLAQPLTHALIFTACILLYRLKPPGDPMVFDSDALG